jgi:hypothetical protein
MLCGCLVLSILDSYHRRAVQAALRRGHDLKVRELIKDLLIKSAREKRALDAAKLSADSMRVGRVSYVRSGMSVSEFWERVRVPHACGFRVPCSVFRV